MDPATVKKILDGQVAAMAQSVSALADRLSAEQVEKLIALDRAYLRDCKRILGVD